MGANRIFNDREERKKIQQDTDRDNFMDWDEALTYGLIDKVLEKRGELPAAAAAARAAR